MGDLLTDEREKKGFGCRFSLTVNKVFFCINFPLVLSALGFIVVYSIALGKYAEEFAGPVAGMTAFALVLNIVLLLITCVGALGFYNRDFTTLLVQSVVLTLIAFFFVVGAIFFSVTSGTIESGNGFAGIAEQIEQNFIIQVFNDCCVNADVFNNGGVAEDNVGFSFGDIVNDELCFLLQTVEDDSTVGPAAESCGGVGNEFAVFEDEFDDFLDGVMIKFTAISWTTLTFMFMDLLFIYYVLCCASKKVSDDEYYSTYNGDGTNQPLKSQPPMAKKNDFVVPPTLGFSQGQKQGISNFVARFSSPREPNPSMPPPGRGRMGEPTMQAPPPRFSMFRSLGNGGFLNFPKFGSAKSKGSAPTLPPRGGFFSRFSRRGGPPEAPVPPQPPQAPVPPTPPMGMMPPMSPMTSNEAGSYFSDDISGQEMY